MSEKQKSPTSAFHMAIGVIATAAVASMLFVVSPQMSARTEALEGVQEANSIRDGALTKVKDIKDKAADSENSLKRLTELTKAFPTTYAQSQFLQMIQQAGDKAGVTVESTTTTVPVDPATVVETANGARPAPAPAPAPGEQVETPDPAAGSFPLAQINVTIQVSGSQQELERFLRGLGSTSRPVIVDNVSVAAGSGERTATIEARTYLSRPLVIPDFKK